MCMAEWLESKDYKHQHHYTHLIYRFTLHWYPKPCSANQVNGPLLIIVI